MTFGDPKAPAPLAISCNDAAASKGTGRWTSEREWVFDFEADLPPGMRCTATVKPEFKSASGALLTGAKSYQFNSGGPLCKACGPTPTSSSTKSSSLCCSSTARHYRACRPTWCALEGVGERVPVRMIEGAQRTDLLKALGLEKRAAKEPLQFPSFACNRRLTSGSQLQLVFGKGVATPSGVANSVEKRFTYRCAKRLRPIQLRA